MTSPEKCFASSTPSAVFPVAVGPTTAIDINDKSFCPFPYIEIETDSIENLEKVVTSLGYTLEDTTSQTIYDILAERGITGSTPGR